MVQTLKTGEGLQAEQSLIMERNFPKKLEQLDAFLQTFSDEEMLHFASLLMRKLDFQKRTPLIEMELILTYRCNLACDYRFMRKQNLRMTRETAF